MHDQRGVAFLLSVIMSIMLSLIGLAISFSATTDYSISTEVENYSRTLYIADAGFAISKQYLRGKNLSTVLAAQSSIPVYLSQQENQPGTFAYRNPLTLLEARNVNFNNPVSAQGSRMDRGWVTPPGGTSMQGGRFFAKVTDNADELGPLDYFSDLDGTVLVRVMGVHPNAPDQIGSYGGSRKNSIVVIESVLKRDMSFNISSPFTIYGPTAAPSQSNMFSGNSFLIDGFDHTGMTADQIRNGNHNHVTGQPAIAAVYDNPGGGDAGTTVQAIYNELSANQRNNLVGAPGYNGVSLRDETEAVRTSPNPDATNIFSPDFLGFFADQIASVADYHYTQDTNLSGGNIQLGTSQDPKITVAEGDLRISGSGSGAGILIVKGELDYQGAFNFDGVVLLLGEGSVKFGGANKSLVGGIFVASLLPDGSGGFTFGIPELTVAGRSNFYFNSGSIAMGLSLLPMRPLSWREVTPEIEPES